MSIEVGQMNALVEMSYLEEVQSLLGELSYAETLTSGQMDAVNRLEDETIALLNKIEPADLEDEEQPA